MATDLPRLYESGIYLPITSHRPPEPFGQEGYKQFDTPGVVDISPQTVGHLSFGDFIFARHPRERHEPSLFPMPNWFIDNTPTTLEIIRHIPQGPSGARLALCRVHSPPIFFWRGMGYSHGQAPGKVVAKVFDPLYYQDYPDPVAAADREYAQEAAAYIHLHSQRGKSTYASKPGLVPHFYGTWTTDVTIAHLVKPFVSKARRKDIKAQEAKDRATFDTASASASAAGASSQAAKLEPQKFRPVRIILMEFIEGHSLSLHLDRTTDEEGYETVRPLPKFENENTRLAIMGSIMDTVSRIEHLGVTLKDDLSPSNFIIVEKAGSNETKNDESKYRVVMTGFSEADVTRYTRMGYDIAEKLPLPEHPLTSRDPDDWHLFAGWIPDDWLNDDEAYETWGESHFDSANYSGPDKIQEVSDEIGWEDDMRKAGNLPYEDDDPEWQQILDEAYPHRHELRYDNKDNFKDKDEYDKANEDMANLIEARRAKEEEEYVQKQLRLMRMAQEHEIRVAKQKAEERDAKQLEQELQAVHITGSSADAPPAPHTASSLATGNLQPSEPSRPHSPVELNLPQPRDRRTVFGEKLSMHVPEEAIEDEDSHVLGFAPMPKQRRASFHAVSSSSTEESKPGDSSMLPVITEEDATPTRDRRRTISTMTTHSESSKSSAMATSGVLSVLSLPEATGTDLSEDSTSDSETKRKDVEMKRKDDETKRKDDETKRRDK